MATNASAAPSLRSAARSSVFSEQRSPISTTFSDLTQEHFYDDSSFAQMADVNDINVVMTQVLGQMNRVVEHVGSTSMQRSNTDDRKLRSKGENAAANNIARNIIAIVTTMNDTTAPWDIEMSLMQSAAPAASEPSSQLGISIPPAASGSREQDSWAKIAAVAPSAGNKIVKYTPNDSARIRNIDNSRAVDPIDNPKRVVWIRGWQESQPLSEVTKNVGQGPIYSMAYSPKDKSVCVIFQHACSAQALCDEDAEHRKKFGRSRFGVHCELVIGLSFPENDDIRRMNPPSNERRRLTFARQQLFTQGMTETCFKSDIYKIVGASNIELVWLFNTGNATVVLSAVPLARLVREQFLKYSRQSSSPYRDVTVSFSHDPCERPMSLITQMPAGGEDRRSGTYGGTSDLPAEISAKNEGTIGRRSNRNGDSRGWQTVGRRR